jgi:Ca2+/Na+ antiporter
MSPRRSINIFLLSLALLALVALVTGSMAMAQTGGEHIVKEEAVLGTLDESKVTMESDNRILFYSGGGHIQWTISEPVAKEIRTAIDSNHDWTVTQYEASNYIGKVDTSLTERHIDYHGAKILSYSLLDKRIETDTEGLIGDVNSTKHITINFIYDAEPSEKSDYQEMSDATFVTVLFDALENQTHTYTYVGKVEIRHTNTFVGFIKFTLPKKVEGDVMSHYVLPLVDYYEYETTYSGMYAPEEDWAYYQVTFSPLNNTLVIFIILLILWLVAIFVPKWIANATKKKPVFGVRAGVTLLAVLNLVFFIIALPDMIVYLLAVIVLVLSCLLAFIVYVRSGLAKDLEKEKSPEEIEEMKASIKDEVRKEMQAAAEEEEKAIDDFDIDEIFYIYKDGRVVTHCRRGSCEGVAEKELVGSMLVAIQGFVTDSFRRHGELDSFEFGENKIAVMTGNHGHLVTVLTGIEPPFLREKMGEVLQKIEGMFAGIIEDWDGDQGLFTGINAMIAPLFDLKRGQKIRAKPQVVQVKSALEFYEGFLRLKVGIMNERKTSITDTVFRLQYDRTALRLNNIDPAYPMDGTAIEIGVISPGEKKSITYYLDPLTCQVTNIDGSATYRDYKGQFQTAMMKRRPAEIVCPIFFTPSTVNVAMLRRLKKDLPYKDSRVFELPVGISLKKVFYTSKEAVTAHSVREVKEFLEPNPFRAEAWFYGKTAETNEEMVIKVTVSYETNTVQVWVASNNLATQAGLIAEVGHVLGKKLKEAGDITIMLLPSTNTELKRKVEASEVMLDGFVEEAEAPPADS